jgi:hypothetical protein
MLLRTIKIMIGHAAYYVTAVSPSRSMASLAASKHV